MSNSDSEIKITVQYKVAFWDVVACALIVSQFVALHNSVAGLLFTEKWWQVFLSFFLALGSSWLTWRYLSDSGEKK
jgi:membrane protein implicated in regulation of membrane protease activity